MKAFFIPYSVNNGRFNMDFDEKLLDFATKQFINADF